MRTVIVALWCGFFVSFSSYDRCSASFIFHWMMCHGNFPWYPCSKTWFYVAPHYPVLSLCPHLWAWDRKLNNQVLISVGPGMESKCWGKTPALWEVSLVGGVPLDPHLTWAWGCLFLNFIYFQSREGREKERERSLQSARYGTSSLSVCTQVRNPLPPARVNERGCLSSSDTTFFWTAGVCLADWLTAGQIWGG